MSKINETLKQRAGTHGDFAKGGILEQELKDIFRKGTNWNSMEKHKRMTLDLISMKISRILEGDSDFDDHWDDIIGYVTKTKEFINVKSK